MSELTAEMQYLADIRLKCSKKNVSKNIH